MELIKQGALLVSLAKGDFVPSETIKLQMVAKVLCFRGDEQQVDLVAAHVALLQDVAERQSTKARGQGFRLQLKQDMEHMLRSHTRSLAVKVLR